MCIFNQEIHNKMASYQSNYNAMAATAPAPKRGVIDWIAKYWFQIFLVALVLHVFLQKDISIRVNMRSLSALEESASVQALPASLNTGSTPAALSMVSNTSIFDRNEKEKSAFYYLLNPKEAKRDQVPREVLVQELERSRQIVERFAKVALAEREKFNLPAGILLAQSILGSQNGDSPLAREGNNYFVQVGGANCRDGNSVTLKMDGKKVEARKFHSAWESFREHSLNMNSPEYQTLQRIPLSDYKAWATGLQELGFSKDRDYAKNLVRIMEILDLDQFDRV